MAPRTPCGYYSSATAARPSGIFGGALGDEDAALALLQEFVLRFLRGDFRRADAGCGRFRDYLKAALIHLVTDYHREQRARPRPLPPDIAERAVAPDEGAELVEELHALRMWKLCAPALERRKGRSTG